MKAFVESSLLRRSQSPFRRSDFLGPLSLLTAMRIARLEDGRLSRSTSFSWKSLGHAVADPRNCPTANVSGCAGKCAGPQKTRIQYFRFSLCSDQRLQSGQSPLSIWVGAFGRPRAINWTSDFRYPDDSFGSLCRQIAPDGSPDDDRRAMRIDRQPFREPEGGVRSFDQPFSRPRNRSPAPPV